MKCPSRMAASQIDLCHKLKRHIMRVRRDWPNTGKPCVPLRSGASVYILLALASCDASRNHFNLGNPHEFECRRSTPDCIDRRRPDPDHAALAQLRRCDLLDHRRPAGPFPALAIAPALAGSRCRAARKLLVDYQRAFYSNPLWKVTSTC